ncbi:MAG: GMC family oxidoreductase [Armatimonadetes bacterium]|nr:GMC family oxidoreductase [Armatimonadota bacterium]
MAEIVEADVSIVGSGVAGALVAWRLASAGARVLILEAGPSVDRARAVAAYREDPFRGLDSPYPDVPYAPRPQLKNLTAHYLQEGPDLLMGLYERRVGGTTWHWLGTAMRLLASDFELRSRYGVGVDWPIGYAELDPWYAQAEEALGVAGPGKPLPPIPAAWGDRVVARALELEPLPQARNSVPHDGRPACCGSASCVPICPIGAKYDASVHVARAVRAGAQLLERAVVCRLEVGEEGRIESLVWKNPDGGERRVRARLYVLAAHSIETPRLLLASRSGAWPEGLANRSGAVGRNLMGGSVQLSWCLAPEPVYPYRAPQATSGSMAFRDGPFRGLRSGFSLAVSTDGWPGSGPEELASGFIQKGLRGRELRHAIRDHVSRQVALASTAEELPDPENRVSAAHEWPDALGNPRPRIRYRVDDYSLRGCREARALHERIFETLQATERAHADRSADPAYILGTCRMGRDPAASVVDTDLRCHDHPNLFLVGGMVFPTSGTAPPTLTVAALALRCVPVLQGWLHG